MALGFENPTFLYKLIDSLGNNQLFSSIYTKYLKTLSFKENDRVLDFGSGSGAGSRHLAKKLQKLHGHLTCVDISEYWMNIAKKRMMHYDHVDYFVGQLPDLFLEAESFDVIYIFYALHDVDKILRHAIVYEFSRILKKDGSLYIKEPQRENDGMPIAEIEELMVQNGFVKDHSEIFHEAFSAVYHKIK